MKQQKKRKKCFEKEILAKDECNTCKDVVDCIMSLYNKPLPSLIIYSADLTE